MNIYKQLEFLNRLPKKDVAIFDVGCGDGRVLKSFYDAGYKVVGIDTSNEKIEKAKKIMPNAYFNTQNITDIESLPNNAFLIAKNSLPFLNSKEKINDFIKKLSKIDGYFSLFGEKDEMVTSGLAISYARSEVDDIIRQFKKVVLFIETIGEGMNLDNKPRKGHKFEIYFINRKT